MLASMKRTLRIALTRLAPVGLAVLLTVAAAGALGVAFGIAPARVAAAQDPDAGAPASGGTFSSDPDDSVWTDDEEDGVTPAPTMPGQDQNQFVPPGEGKGTVADPDSLVRARANRPGGEGRGAGIDSTFLKPPAAGAAKPLQPLSIERKPPLGLHPAVLFLGLLVGHIFAVRAVTK